MMPFSSDFSRKNNCSHAQILSKNGHSLKNKLLSCPYFVKKTSILSKTQSSHVMFFKFFMKKPRCHAHMWSKDVNSVKTTNIMGQKSQQDALFFRFFTRKSMLSCPYFVQKKRKISKKHNVLMPIFCQKKPNPLKKLLK